MADETIQFKNNNFLPLMNSNNWIKSDGVYLNNSGDLILPSGSSIEYEITDFASMSFAYYKIIVNAQSEGFSPESSLDSDVVMSMLLNYSSYTGEVSSSENCSMNIATTNHKGDNEYTDIKIMDTQNVPIFNCRFSIVNHLLTDLIIKSVKLYTSEDFSESQFVETLNKYQNLKMVRKAIFGTNADQSELRYIKAYTNESNNYIKIKPYYNGNTLTSIVLSTGESILCEYELDEDDESLVTPEVET